MTSWNSGGTEHRLPRAVAPVRYDLHLAPDLDAARFVGTVSVRVDVREPVDEIVCNSVDLEIDGAVLVPLDASGDSSGEQVPLSVALDPESQRATFALAPLPAAPPAAPANGRAANGTPHVVEPGPYRLDISFAGVLNDQLRGFYRSTFTDSDGTEHVIATTQFEATDARRAFPCWDEPDRKAVFSVTLDVPAGLTAVSNWPEASSEQLADGRRRVRFGDTIPMSTYLVAFVVGPLETTEPVDVDGVAVRVVHRPRAGAATVFALEAAVHALRFFVDWFALPYPCPKLDLLALPDFAAGAMENLGAVTFREAALLVDPDHASQPELERVASTIDHEIAHMWFGDLVTMRWWNGIWLNEAFATYMSMLCLDDFRPEWRVWDTFARDRAYAMQVDALHATRPVEYPVHGPEEAEGMFDTLTYDKGGSVLRMLERFVGTERFRAGVRDYLAGHVEGNTETTDLWDAIEEATENEPVRSLMDSWIFQGGFPLLEVAATEDGARLSAEPFARLREGEHALTPGEPPSGIGRDWLIPVIVGRRTEALPSPLPAAPEDLPHSTRLVLGAAPASVELTGEVEAPVVANAGGYGFYRVRYDEELLGRLAGALDRLTPLERYCLVSDSWVCAHSGVVPLESFLSLVRRLEGETDPGVWSVVAAALDTLDRAVPEDDRAALQDFARSVLGPQLQRVGWEAAAGEDPLTETLRAGLVKRLGTVAADDEVRAECTRRFSAERDGAQRLPAGIARAVLAVVAHWGGEDELDALLQGMRKAANAVEERRYLAALADLGRPELAQRVHQLCLTELRAQDAPDVLELQLGNRMVQAVTWEFVTTQWDELLARFPRNHVADAVAGVGAFEAGMGDDGRSPLAENARAFLLAHPLPGLEKQVGQHLEVLEVNLAFARRERARLGEVLRRA